MTRNKIAVAAIAAGLLLVAAGSANAQSHIQFSNMHDFATGEDIAGAGSLTRTTDQLWVNLALSGLDKKSAYTLWWVVFNSPDECVDGCGGDDIDDGRGAASILRAGGFGTGTDGTANVSAHLNALDIVEPSPVLFGDALIPSNGLAAEIHLIVRSHAKYVVGRVDEQIGSVGGACDVNDCEDQQAIMFLPIIP